MDRTSALACLDAAEGTHPSFGNDDIEATRRFMAEHEHFEQALGFFHDNGMFDEGLRLATALHIYWMEHGHLTTGRAWLQKLLAAPNDAQTSVRVRALNAAGRLAFRQGDNEVARSLLDEALALARGLGDRDGEAWALSIASRVSLRDHDFVRVREQAQASTEIFTELGDAEAAWSPLHVLAYVTMMEGSLPQAKNMFLESIELARSLGNDSAASGEYQNLGIINTRLGNYQEALANFRECFEIAIKDNDTYLMPYAFLGLAAVAAARGEADRAARLLGITDGILASTEMVLDPGDQPDYDGAVKLARDKLGEKAFDAASAEGRAMALDDAVAYARSSMAMEPGGAVI